MQEFTSLLQLLAWLITDPRTGVLIALLIAAAVIDYRSYKIPNWLTFSGAVFGLAWNTIHPQFPHATFLWTVGGLMLGLLVMLPMYALKVMGAGDVKLMAMTGAFLGMADILRASLWVLIIGGLGALAFALFHKSLGRLFGNVRDVTQSMMAAAIGGALPDARLQPVASLGRLPYGVCIALGVIAFVVARQLGYA